MSQHKKVLIVAHGHPDHAKGGGEIAAYNLHNGLNQKTGYQSVFFARHHQPDLLHGGTPVAGTGRPGEILFHATMPDWFRFSQVDKALVWRDFRDTLNICQPDVVHFHHYVHLGLEFIREVKSWNPDVPVILTLHEYFGICHNHGQMIKTDKSLCQEASPGNCARCFPQYSSQDFMLRELFIKSHFDLVDRFISPSQFLKDRYVAWGLPADKIQVIENVLDVTTHPDADHQSTEARQTDINAQRKVRFAFFGQINWFKGLDVLLDAVKGLPKEVRRQLQIDINGSGLKNQSRPLQELINKRVKSLSGSVNFRGAYTQSELHGLMSAADWLVVPSRWWENSPMVMLEARKHGLPVICSDIGGMVEKIDPGKTGLHFQAGRAESLADALMWAVQHRDQQVDFSNRIAASYRRDEAMNAHMALYQQQLLHSVDVQMVSDAPDQQPSSPTQDERQVA